MEYAAMQYIWNLLVSVSFTVAVALVVFGLVNYEPNLPKSTDEVANLIVTLQSEETSEKIVQRSMRNIAAAMRKTNN